MNLRPFGELIFPVFLSVKWTYDHLVNLFFQFVPLWNETMTIWWIILPFCPSVKLTYDHLVGSFWRILVTYLPLLYVDLLLSAKSNIFLLAVTLTKTIYLKNTDIIYWNTLYVLVRNWMLIYILKIQFETRKTNGRTVNSRPRLALHRLGLSASCSCSRYSSITLHHKQSSCRKFS